MHKYATPFALIVLAIAIVWAANIMKPTRSGECTKTDMAFVEALMAAPFSKHNPVQIDNEDILKLKKAREEAKAKLMHMGFGGCFEE